MSKTSLNIYGRVLVMVCLYPIYLEPRSASTPLLFPRHPQKLLWSTDEFQHFLLFLITGFNTVLKYQELGHLLSYTKEHPNAKPPQIFRRALYRHTILPRITVTNQASN